MFFRQWPLFIEHLTIEAIDIYIVGDVNFHLDFDTNIYKDARKFKGSLSNCGLKQHIHCLDVLFEVLVNYYEMCR